MSTSFDLVVEEEEFLELDESLVAKLISHDELNTEEEERVLRALLRGVRYDEANRLAAFERLVIHVRFALIRSESLIGIEANGLVRQSEKCQRCIKGVSNQINERSPMNGQRRLPPRLRQQRIYAVTGCSSGMRTSVVCYNPYLDEWTELELTIFNRYCATSVVVDDSLYVIGGDRERDGMRSAERYDLIRRAWHRDVEDMPCIGLLVGAVELDGLIYVINCRGRINIAKNSWEHCELQEPREAIKARMTASGGKIYVIGGRSNGVMLRTVKCYDSVEKKWISVAPMKTGKSDFGYATLGGKIYVVGGRRLDDCLDSAECYDPLKG